MNETSISNDSEDELWELVEFCAREALLLRSFLEYLKTWPDSADKKQARLQNWKKEVGVQLGNPNLSDYASQLFQRLRAAPPQGRKLVLQKALEEMHSNYF